MVLRNAKRILATIVAGVMVVGASVTAFAATSTNETGLGVVEYDNSEHVEYDVVSVPVMPAHIFDFVLDPTGMLNEFDPATYETQETIYFSAVKTAATIKGAANVTLYTLSKEKVAASDWGTVVKTVTNKAVVDFNGDFYVWIPDEATSTTDYTKGKAGKYEKITAANFTNWFELSDPEDATSKDIKLTSGYKSVRSGGAGADNIPACDGNIYRNKYDAVTNNTITETDTLPLTKYVTLGADKKTVTAVQDLYTDNTGTAATDSDVVYTPQVVNKQNRTVNMTVENKSTKDKTVTAAVSIKNISGITFTADTTGFTNADTDTKMYMAVKAGTTEKALLVGDDEGTASVTYTAKIDKPTYTDILYSLGTENSATGGHNYGRYESAGTTYNENSFYITAQTNGTQTNKAAWDEWAQSVTQDTRPEIKIVYSVVDYIPDSAPSVSMTTGTYSKASGLVITGVSLGHGSLAANAVSGFGITGTASNADPVNDLTSQTQYWSYANGEITVAAGLWGSANAGDKRYIKVTFDDSAHTVAWIECTIAN
jgi:hypothetical protein